MTLTKRTTKVILDKNETLAVNAEGKRIKDLFKEKQVIRKTRGGIMGEVYENSLKILFYLMDSFCDDSFSYLYICRQRGEKEKYHLTLKILLLFYYREP